MDGRTEEMRARWVIGADGAASTVRRLQTNSSFTTQTVAGESSKGLASLRRLRTDPEFLLQRLMFTKSLQTPPLLENAR